MPRQPVSVAIAALLVVLIAGAGSAPAVRATGPSGADERSLLAELGGHVRVGRDRATGQVRSLRGGRRPIVTSRQLGGPRTAQEAGRAFLDRFGSLLVAPAERGPATARADRGRSRADLRLARVERTRRAGTYLRYQQEIDGVPVMGGDVVVVVDGRNGVRAARGEGTPAATVSTTPRIGGAAAARIATAAVARATGVPRSRLHASRPERWVFDPSLLGGRGLPYARLVWRTSVGDIDRTLDQLVAVDARTGAVVLRFDQRPSLAPRDAAQRTCDQESARESVLDQLPCTASSAETPPYTGEARRAALATEATFDFYWNRFGYDLGAAIGDGTAHQLVSTVRYCPRPAGGTCPYHNAFWDGYQMVYGTGFASADDVVGHELTHGVTERGPNLFYYMQSGAISESLSDIFGELIDLTNDLGAFDDDSPAARWLVGEDTPIGAIRDMADPAAYGQPDRMGSASYDDDPLEVDGGGVHTNSGVGNRALALMVDGGSPDGVSVPPLDADPDTAIDQAAAIWFLAGYHLLTTASDYADLADALQIACDQLAGVAGGVLDRAGDASVPIDAVEACGPDGTVTRAIEATQLRLDPPRAPVARVRPCTDPDAQPIDLLYDPVDQGGTGWQLDSGADRRWSIASAYGYRDPDDTDPEAPTWHLHGADRAWTGSGRVARTTPVDIPAAGRPVFLWFRHAHGFDDGSEDQFPNDNRYDGGVVEVRVDGGAWTDIGRLLTANGYDGTLLRGYQNPLAGRDAFTAESNGYGATRASLTGFPELDLRGRAVRLSFRIATDSAYGGEGWFIDDVRIYRCGDTADDAAPVVSAPEVTLRARSLTPDGRVPVGVAFEADDPSGIALTRLERSIGVGPATSILPSVASRDARIRLPSGTFRVHLVAGATDEQGNVSPLAARHVRVRVLQESDATFGGAWRRATAPAFSGGAARRAGAAGRTAALTVRDATAVGFVSTLGPDRGTARVCVDGARCRVVDLYAREVRARRIVATWDFAVPSARTVSVEVLGQKRSASAGTRVDLDAVVAITR